MVGSVSESRIRGNRRGVLVCKKQLLLSTDSARYMGQFSELEIGDMKPIQKFDRLWDNSSAYKHLPRGSILFEGQCKDKDLVSADQGSILQRKRPTSTSWQLNVALHFAFSGAGSWEKVLHKNPTLLVHHIEDDAVRAIYVPTALSRERDEEEFEVLLQPGLHIQVTQVFKFNFSVNNLYRVAMPLITSPTEVTVKFTRVSALPRPELQT